MILLVRPDAPRGQEEVPLRRRRARQLPLAHEGRPGNVYAERIK